MIGEKINIAIKYAEIDDKPFSNEHEGWVSRLVILLQQTFDFYFDKPVVLKLKKETELIRENEFKELDAIIYILSPAFLFSSNLSIEISAIEKAVLFDTDHLNTKIHKVLKAPINAGNLPVTISMGAFHYFYQLAESSSDSSYETIFDWDNSATVRKKYWESFTNLFFKLLKCLEHPKHDRFMPPPAKTFYLGKGGIAQLWNRTNLLGEFNSRGVRVLPDHDHSIEVKHLKEPEHFYLQKSDLAIHFPEEFLPMETEKWKGLADFSSLKRYIWFDPESEKELEKKKLYDELKQKLKNLDHVEVVSSGLEELKEIIFASHAKEDNFQGGSPEDIKRLKLYLICSGNFSDHRRVEIIRLLDNHLLDLLFLEKEKIQEKRVRHYQYLKEADYCLICYDGKNPEWLRANINEVKKGRGLNPDKKQEIKLGLIAGRRETLAELKEYAGSFQLISAESTCLNEDINVFLNG